MYLVKCNQTGTQLQPQVYWIWVRISDVFTSFTSCLVQLSLLGTAYNYYPQSSSSSRIWSATKRLHPQSVAEISRHSVLSLRAQDSTMTTGHSTTAVSSLRGQDSTMWDNDHRTQHNCRVIAFFGFEFMWVGNPTAHHNIKHLTERCRRLHCWLKALSLSVV